MRPHGTRNCYLSDAAQGFSPPAPFTLAEIDFESVIPDPYSKAFSCHDDAKRHTMTQRFFSLNWFENRLSRRGAGGTLDVENHEES